MEFSRAWYEERNGNLVIVLKNDGKRYEVKANILPYFFTKAGFSLANEKDVLAVEPTNFKTLKGEPVQKVECRFPRQVGNIVKSLEARGIPVYEGDVPYVRRWMIDNDLHVKAEGWSKLYLDIECESDIRQPITEWKIKSVAGVDNEGAIFYKAGEEGEVLTFLLKLLDSYDIILGWNSSNFDVKVIASAMVRNGYGHLRLVERKLREEYCFLDILECCKRTFAKSYESWSLDYVAMKELGKGKTVVNMDVKVKPYSQLTDSEKDLLREYNIMDCMLVKEIDEKYGLSDVNIMLASMTYVFPDDTMSISKPIDSVLLRMYRDRGYVLPNMKEKRAGGYKGAYVREYARGVYEDVVFYDVQSLYPNIIINFHVSPEPEKEVLPEMISKFLATRVAEKKRYKETKDQKANIRQNALKIMINATYGFLGAKYTRFADYDLAPIVSAFGRRVLRTMVEYFEKEGLTVLAGDTDSVAVKIPVPDRNVIEAHRRNVEEYVKNAVGKPFTIEVDKYFKRVFFAGVKKRYVGYLDDGTLLTVGFETVRGDWFPRSKEVEAELFKIILNAKDVSEIKAGAERLLDEVRGELWSGNVPLEKYLFSVSGFRRGKVKTRQVRAVEKLVGMGIILEPGTKVRFLVGEGGEIFPYVQDRFVDSVVTIDREFYYNRVVRLVNRITGLGFEEIKKRKVRSSKSVAKNGRTLSEFI